MHAVQDRIADLLVTHLRVPADTITTGATFESLGIDSLVLVELALMLADDFEVEIHDGELIPDMTIGIVAKLVTERGVVR
jgi:acyl carrier protein